MITQPIACSDKRKWAIQNGVTVVEQMQNEKGKSKLTDEDDGAAAVVL